MPDLQWVPDDDCWVLSLTNNVFDELEIRVFTDGESDPPTPKQIEIVESICKLTNTDRETIAAVVRKWAEDNWDAEEFEELEDEDFEYEISTVLVPRLRDAESEYFIFIGRSEIEPEHGLACVCKDGSQYAICHPDHGYEHFDWDAVDELDALLTLTNLMPRQTRNPADGPDQRAKVEDFLAAWATAGYRGVRIWTP